PVRDMMFREDHVDAYLSVIGEPHALRETFNFCTGRGLSIAEFVEICREATDYKGEVEWYTVPVRPLDIDRLVGDPGKAGRVLGWEAGWSVERGVEWMVDYWHGKLTQ
ncbi:GDP-mannose 4,6-dehydratase, partial [candidate division WOR-3 bacterium]|nr:GDP-mannose 4,6-dehydratase [candidate division WOR-3 bacterium]